MRLDLDVSLDPTLGCGQAHRWRKNGDIWNGVLGNDIIDMTQHDGWIEVDGCDDRERILSYFRADDDLDAIIEEISHADPYVASLSSKCPGMRILRQDKWECLATYLLATNANVRRIGSMVESVCNTFGRNLGGRHAFPTPREILDGQDCIWVCKLGFREQRFIELAQKMEDGDLDLDAISEMGYDDCVKALMTIKGVGPKVADCVALFAFDHLDAFPVDVRIAKVMENIYGVTGGYGKVSAYGREKFGRFAGYAQEFLYHSGYIE